MEKVKAKGRNKIILVADDSMSVGHRSSLQYKENTPIVVPATPSEASANTGRMPDFRETEDYYFFPFRQISKTIVGGGTWKATDFSVGDVLERSTELLNRKPAYRDHFTAVGNSIGMVVNPVWQSSYTNELGQEIPAGIDAEFVINRKIESLQELAEHLKSEYNPYNAASVGVVFDWEASHEFENVWDFYDLLGQTIIDENGNESMVRRIVTNVDMYYESSLVAFGADQYARQKKDGKVEMFSHSDLVGGAILKEEDERLQKEYKEKGKFFVFSSAEEAPRPASPLSSLKASENAQETISLTKEKKLPMNQELIGFALAMLGKQSIEDVTKEQIPSDVEEYSKLLEARERSTAECQSLTAKLEAAEADRDQFRERASGAEAELIVLKREKQDLEGELAKAKPYAEYAQAKREELVGRVKALYTTSVNGDISPEIISEIEGNSLQVLEAKASTFGAKIGFSGSCKDCGSHNIQFRSSEHTPSAGQKPESAPIPLWKAL